MSVTTLTQLANRYHSDKGDQVGCCHRYASLYEQIFAPYRDQPISFLEIGLQREFLQSQPDCPSLRMWREYFPQARISGLDIADFSGVEIPGVQIFRGDQSDADALRSVAEAAGPFDVIIEDGYHASRHQQITVGTLFPFLNPGGTLVIEDAHWQPERGTEIKQGIETTQAMFKRWALYGQPLRSPFMTAAQCDQIDRETSQCIFSHPVTDWTSPRPKSSSPLRQLARRLIKGKPARTDARNFKLIVLRRRQDGEPAGLQTVALHPLSTP